MGEPNNERNEITFSAKTDVSIHRQLAEEEGLSIRELHEKITSEKSNQILAEIRKEKGIELLTREELQLMIDELSSMEKELSNMETSQLLTLIHQGYGKLPKLAAATLLKVKKDASYEIIKKLRKLLNASENENENDDEANSSTNTPNLPQLNNPELDKTIQEIQGIVKNPETIQEEIACSEISNAERPEPSSSEDSENNKSKNEKEKEEEEEKVSLPKFKIRNALSTVRLLENLKAANVDDRLGMNFLLEVPRQTIWNNLCENTEETLIELRNYLKKTDGNVNKLIEQILNEYESVISMPLPDGYNDIWKDKFGKKIERPVKPFLMQLYETWLIKQQKSRLNLSDAGAGKTLAAALASQACNSKLTLIFSPRHVIDSWELTFKNAFPNVEVLRQTWNPNWKKNDNRVLIINYERLKTDPKTHNLIMHFAQNQKVDFVILDETHIAKQRGTLETISKEEKEDDVKNIKDDENVSARRKELETLLIELRNRRPEMRIYGLTASPALNDLTEPITLLSLINPGRDVSMMNSKANIPNGLKVHQELTMVSTRWRQSEESKNYKVNRKLIKVNISNKLDDLINNSSFYALIQEQHALDGKIIELRKILSDGEPTIIFVHHVEGIVEEIKERLAYYGYSVGSFYGSDKSGLKPFLRKENQILIASMSAIGTGFDGLQNHCSRAIFFALPWTYEMRKQCEARIARTGQNKDCVIITLEAFYEVNDPKIKTKDNIWSWDKEVAKLIHSKREMSDLVVDGEIASVSTESLLAKAQEGRKLWIERLQELGGITYKKENINIPIVFKNLTEKKKLLGKFGNDFSQINAKWNSSRSAYLYEKIKKDPTEFALYHTFFRENRKTWATIPLNEVIKYLKDKEGLVIGDFGCGEGDLAKEIGDKSKVFSFDMHAVNDSIIQCNIADGVPIAPNSLDIVVFSLSLMTKDWRDMLKTAKKALKKITGQIIIWNPKKKIEEDELEKSIEEAGFRIISKDNSINIEPFINIRAVVDDGGLS
ncbi:MAG: SNF2-related protein [Prochlorococcus marinus XMU1429]|nr:SNF2-related protein [Prochlorococcus marinus XMU1429]